MNIEYIKSYLVICKHKSISKAAQSLYVSQPTLTNRMKQLENYLDIKLFERSWKGIELTEAGSLFLPLALNLVNKLEKYKSLSVYSALVNKSFALNSPNESSNCYKIGVSYYLISFAETILNLLTEEYPDLEIEIITGSTKDLFEKSKYGLLDFIFYYCLDSNLPNTTILKKEDLVIILSNEDYQLIKDDIQLIKNINKPLFVNENPAQDEFLPLYDMINKKFDITDVMLIDNEQLTSILIQANKGYTILPESIYHNYFKRDCLRKVHIPKSSLKMSIYSSFNDNHEVSLNISTFLNNVLRNQLGAEVN